MLPGCWLSEAATPSVEYRLAAAAASLGGSEGGRQRPFRTCLEPVRVIGGAKRWVDWADAGGMPASLRVSNPVDWLSAIVAARLRSPAPAAAGVRAKPAVSARLGDVAAFIERRTNDQLLAALLCGLALVDFDPPPELEAGSPGEEAIPPALYGLLKLCFPDHWPAAAAPSAAPAIHRCASAGQGGEAARLAARCLYAQGRSPSFDRIPVGAVSARAARRTAAALLFPITEGDFAALASAPFRSNGSLPIAPARHLS
jgi:CRISPR-associated protein Csx17